MGYFLRSVVVEVNPGKGVRIANNNDIVLALDPTGNGTVRTPSGRQHEIFVASTSNLIYYTVYGVFYLFY